MEQVEAEQTAAAVEAEEEEKVGGLLQRWCCCCCNVLSLRCFGDVAETAAAVEGEAGGGQKGAVLWALQCVSSARHGLNRSQQQRRAAAGKHGMRK